MADVRQILLTHIHLDHAGCTGTLVKENPSIDVFVHSSGCDTSRGSNQAALERDALVRPGHGPAVGRVPARSPRAAPRVEGWRNDPGRGPDPASRLHPGTCVASRQLLRAVNADRVRRRHRRDPARDGEVRHAGIAAPGRRSRAMARERGENSRLGARHAVPHAFRAVQRCPPAFPRVDEPDGRVGPDRQASRGRRAPHGGGA